MTEPVSPGPAPTHQATARARIRERLPRLQAPGDTDKTWSMAAHFGGAVTMLITFGVGGWIGPLVVLLTKGTQSPTVRGHAVNALNFQLLWSIIGLLAWLVAWRPPVFLPLLVVTAIGVVCGVIGGIRANESRPFTYPLTVQLIK
jgi:uncharacterized Tic20 family protein